MSLFLYLVIGLSAGWLAAYYHGQYGLMVAAYMAAGVGMAMLAGGLLSMALNLLKTLILLVLAAALVVMVAKLLPERMPVANFPAGPPEQVEPGPVYR